MRWHYLGTTVPHERATDITRPLFTGGGLGYYHSPLHPLPDLTLHNPIRIVNLDADKWWAEMEESYGNGNLWRLHNYVVEAWSSMRMELGT